MQTAELERLYYLKDPYAGKKTASDSLLVCDCASIVTTCRKKAEKGGTLLRFVNLSDAPQEVNFTFRGKMYLTDMPEETETFAGESQASVSFRPKQIVSVRISDV